MAISVSDLYEALVEAGASKEQARRAAGAVISRHAAERELATKADISHLETRLAERVEPIRSDLITWNVGAILAAVGVTIALVRLL